MASIELEGDTLGQKQRNYNNLVRAANADDNFKLSKLNYNESDINNMLRIDVACNRRMVEYILDVLKCQDILYVSHAIKGSVWLVFEEQYANIINPEYLNEELFPNMMINAKNKLLASIQKNLKVSARAEAFFNYYKDNFSVAQHWLRHCSIDFAQNIVVNHADEISCKIIKYLCRKSSKILKCYLNSHLRDSYLLYRHLLHAKRQEAIEILDLICSGNEKPKFRKKFTRSLMKRYPQDIIANFNKYYHSIHLPTFVKYIEKEDIENILTGHIKNDFMKHFFTYENLKHFFRYMPETKRLQFIRMILAQEETDSNSKSASSLADLKGALGYRCYEFISFDSAFHELQNIITTESSPYKRNLILGVLVSSARDNSQNIHTLLEYYQSKHMGELYENKVQFLNKVLSPRSLNKFSERVWSILDDIFTSMDFYADTNKNVPKCFEVMVVYKLIHDEQIPGTFIKKVNFESFLDCRSKLNDDEQRKVLNYVFESCFTKSYKKDVVNEEEMSVMVDLITGALVLLKNWNKGPDDYPVVIASIREIIKANIDKRWGVNLSTLYKVHKSFMRQLHNESMDLYPCDMTGVYALKHDFNLLSRYREELVKKCFNESVSLKRTYKKMRIYWPKSTVQQWVDNYLDHLQYPAGYKTLVEGLLILLPYTEAMSFFVKRYASDDTISECNNNDIRLRQNIVRYIYLLRPSSVNETTLLLYARKEYIHYLLPSFDIILRNKSSNDFWRVILALLKYGPLHKYAVRLVHSVLKKNVMNCDQKMKFKLIGKLEGILCQETNEQIVLEISHLVNDVYDDLLPCDKEKMYTSIFQVNEIVKPKLFMKMYSFVKSTKSKSELDKFLVSYYAEEAFNFLESAFIEEVIMKIVRKEILKSNDDCSSSILFMYLLNCDNEKKQNERFEKVLIPIMEHYFKSWDEQSHDSYWPYPISSKHGLYRILESLASNFITSINKFKAIAPVQLFSNIRNKLENVLSLEKDLNLIMTWNLYVILVEKLRDHLKIDKNIFIVNHPESILNSNCLEFVGSIGQAWLEYFMPILLDCDSFHLYVSRVTLEVFYIFRLSSDFNLVFVKWLLTNNDERLLYFVAIDILRHVYIDEHRDDNRILKNELVEMIRLNPSVDVKLYYNHYVNKLTI